MSWINDLPVWATALLIFALRIGDVSLGTMRTLSVVQGRIVQSVALGFFEVLIWVIGISQVMGGLRESPVLGIAYALGFAAGNAVGIAIEQRLAMGSVVLRIISPRFGREIADHLRRRGYRLTTFDGQGRDGPVTMLLVTCRRRDARSVLGVAREYDASLFYTVESLRERSGESCAMPLPHATGWRAVMKKK